MGYDMASGLGLPVGNVLAAAVRALAVSPFSVSSTSLPGGVVGASYSASLQGAGGVAPYAWSITLRIAAGRPLPSARRARSPARRPRWERTTSW